MNNNKVAIKTGASKGIGRSTALKFASNNYKKLTDDEVDDLQLN